MKTPKYIILALALALGSAQAITLDMHKNTVHKLDFTVDWHEPDSDQFYNGFSNIYAEGTSSWVEIWGVAGSGSSFFSHPEIFVYFASFDLIYGPDDTFLGLNLRHLLQIPGQESSRFINFAEDNQSARFTYHAHDFPPIVSVPDAGSTLMLLGMALGLIGYGKLKCV